MIVGTVAVVQVKGVTACKGQAHTEVLGVCSGDVAPYRPLACMNHFRGCRQSLGWCQRAEHWVPGVHKQASCSPCRADVGAALGSLVPAVVAAACWTAGGGGEELTRRGGGGEFTGGGGGGGGELTGGGGELAGGGDEEGKTAAAVWTTAGVAGRGGELAGGGGGGGEDNTVVAAWTVGAGE
jgi:hypothetical protein